MFDTYPISIYQALVQAHAMRIVTLQSSLVKENTIMTDRETASHLAILYITHIIRAVKIC